MNVQLIKKRRAIMKNNFNYSSMRTKQLKEEGMRKRLNKKENLFSKCFAFQEFRKNFLSLVDGQNPYVRVVDPSAACHVKYKGKSLVMLGSNNYLNLSLHPKVKNAARKAIDEYGTGAGSSRPLTGTTSLHIQLEKALSEYKNTEDSLLFPTGYMTMMGIISCMVTKDDVVFSDQLNHASIIDGISLSNAQVQIYKHNDMSDLEEKLALCDPGKNKFIVTDGVFSMMGTIANLPEIRRLADKYGAAVMVDDAHGSGILGENGHGILEHFHMENQIDFLCSTFSKVFGTVGGAVGAKKAIIEFIRFNSRPFVYTASLPPSVVATVLAGLQVIKEEPELLQRLRKNADFMRKSLTELNFRIGHSPTPIIPLFIGDDEKTLRMSTELEEEGVFVNPILPPGVSVESSLIRISIMANHSQDDLEFALDKFKTVGKRLNLI